MNLSDILGERLAIVGGTGSGKSYTARGLVEKVLAIDHGRVGIIDPTGVWHGLRVNADGRSAGFPVVIFGGDRSDVPLIETAGRVVAQAVASSHQSWIIDTSALKTKAAERRFMLDFLDALFDHNRADITLVVDEADRFSPQRMSPETARLHERMEEIVRRGRVRGFTPWLITQRPASLNKDVLSQATAMICMRMTGAHDRGAMADVIEGQADKATAREIIGSMPGHKVGHGLVWAPQRGILQAVHFPKIVTLDTMRAPKPGERRADKPLPPIDLGALREKLATVETEAKANDPRALKAEIARLKAELAKAPTAVDPRALEAAQQAGYQDGYRTGRMHAFGRADGDLAAIETALGQSLHAIREKWAAEKDSAPPPGKSLPPAKPRPVSISAPPRTIRGGNGQISSTPGSGELIRGERQILTVLAQYAPAALDKSRLGAIAGFASKGGSFRTYVGRLKTLGYIDRVQLRITQAGLEALGDFTPLPTGPALLEHWCGRLIKGEREILQAVARNGGEASRDEIGAATGFEPSGGSFRTYVGKLKTLGLLTGSNPLLLHEDLR